MEYVLITILLLVGAVIAGRLLRGRLGPEPPTTVATAPPPAEPPPDTPSVYETILPLMEVFNTVAHPSELVGFPAVMATVALFQDSACPDERLLKFACGDHVGLRCAAFLAIAERGPAYTATDRVVAEVATLSPWFQYFGLRAVAACVPANQPVVGELLINISIDVGGRSWAGQAPAVESLREFLIARVQAGEPAGFTPAQQQMIEQHGSAFDIRRLLGRLGDDVTEGWRSSVEPVTRGADESSTDLASTGTDGRGAPGPKRTTLSQLGRVWDQAPLAPGRQLLETPAQPALVDRLLRALEATPPRPCLLVGEPGVGKRAIFEALARRLLALHWKILEAGHTDIIANQKYLGEMEGRLQIYVREMSRPRRLWFIPDLGELRATGSHEHKQTGALHLLLPLFEAGDLRVVGTLTPSAWDALQQSVPAARGLFEVITIEPLGSEESQALARARLAAGSTPGPDLPAPEDDRVIGEAWLLAQQFLSSRAAPGNLLQLIDQTRRRVARAGSRQVFGRTDLIATLAELTGLPTSFLDDRQNYDLQEVRAFFRERILGQDEAVECLVQRIAMLKAGLSDPSRPQGVFLFAGPTGTGKTEIAKVLAEFLFGTPDRLIRVDMSEYNERGAGARLLRAGSALAEAGGGSLVSRVRQRPFSVVLLDEFEKAASDVWDLFLQVADDGRLTDDHGETVDFRHTIIILTSNLGARVPTASGVGFGRGVDAFRPQEVEKALDLVFRKEFINRLDRVVVFRPFTRETMRELLRLEIRKAERRRGLRHRDWATIWDDSAVDFLLERGFTGDLGARPLRRAVERYLLEPLATIIAQGRNPAGDQFLFVHTDGDRLIADFIDPDAPAPPRGDETPAGAGVDGVATPQSVLLTGRGDEHDLAALARVHADLEDRVRADDLRRRKSEGLAAMARSDFWEKDDRFAVLGRIESIDRVESGLESAGQLLEMLTTPTRGGRGTLPGRAVSPELLVKLAGSLHLLDAAVTALVRDESWDAYLLVDAGGDGGAPTAEADTWARRIAAMYERWADQRRFKRDVLLESGGQGGQPWRQVTALSGYAACQLLGPENGLHVWEEPDPRREGGFRRQPVLVRAVAQPQRAAADRATATREALDLLIAPSPDRLQLVRHYRELPSPLVRDRVKGWRTGRLERVLAGDFDLMGGG